ncbi:DUF1194 domain-containing protein [Reyranella sp. CPCC 100927]|uniref:DUF1194 domain-containing protein n=1 Tax=Reyranella sp. CPCC 100927 TaxID=2599616 RepID=UPI0015B749E5|nr:DUF1194 domain-containing protein [Reyranella sp. CPCC 100927]
MVISRVRFPRFRWRQALLSGAALLGLSFGPDAVAQEAKEVDLALVLAVDISGSIDPDEAELQRQGYVKAFTDPQIRKAILGGYNGRIAVTYFEWSDAWRQQLLIDWTLLDSEAAIETFAKRLGEVPITVLTRTSISGAIRYAIPLFERMPYTTERMVLDISGDGANNDGELITTARDEALARRITINGLPIMNGRPNKYGFPPDPDLDRYYEGCVIGGPRSFLVVATSFNEFHEAVRKKLLQEIANITPDGKVRASDVPQRRQGVSGERQVAQAMEGSMPAPGKRPYALGCDIGERRSREFWQRRFQQ